MNKPLKVHLFNDCPNIYPRKDPEIGGLCDVTCGQCKGRVLSVIRDKDWSKLPETMKLFLGMYSLEASRG